MAAAGTARAARRRAQLGFDSASRSWQWLPGSVPTEDEVAKPEWGLKRACRDCGKRFYDFHRNPIVCPGCQAVFDPLAMLRPRRARPAAVAAPASRVEAAAAKREPEATGDGDTETEVIAVQDSDIDDDTDVDREDDDGMIKDTADLGDDDISDVIDDDA